ncbi:ATP-binding protein [Desulfosporosinus youngiae]|uniref:AAA+ family ATPase n=1 Tax=Desulfosporosinus youngiae DSM 17734 TaxID=768710 RepID=H5Y259_9FIRM|nr:ATP-binding protein [Desulfosporosinus youngiae]EHQ88257.1 AAA+ family ATPase [Desulfosporosinus youngiae DSM 17734]
MNDKVRNLIRAVAMNDIREAKQWVKVITESDSTKSNRPFCKYILNQLQVSSLNLMELPHDIKGILLMEDVSMTFNENRYFLSEREDAVTEEVLGMYETSQKLSEMGIRYLNSLMLHGESGTGKTLFGRYLAYMIGLPFAYMNFSNAISSYLGSTAKNINKAFEFIGNHKCVFMIDEVDAIGMKRGKEDVGEMARVTIGLMQALDCVRNDTVLIGATNRLDMIDPALLRRFTMIHEVAKFSEQEMFLMVSKFLDDVGVKYSDINIIDYCGKSLNSQALVMNDVIRAIAKSIRNNTEFRLMTEG